MFERKIHEINKFKKINWFTLNLSWEIAVENPNLLYIFFTKGSSIKCMSWRHVRNTVRMRCQTGQICLSGNISVKICIFWIELICSHLKIYLINLKNTCVEHRAIPELSHLFLQEWRTIKRNEWRPLLYGQGTLEQPVIVDWVGLTWKQFAMLFIYYFTTVETRVT